MMPCLFSGCKSRVDLFAAASAQLVPTDSQAVQRIPTPEPQLFSPFQTTPFKQDESLFVSRGLACPMVRYSRVLPGGGKTQALGCRPVELSAMLPPQYRKTAAVGIMHHDMFAAEPWVYLASPLRGSYGLFVFILTPPLLTPSTTWLRPTQYSKSIALLGPTNGTGRPDHSCSAKYNESGAEPRTY